MPTQRDYYEVLGVSRDASADEIKAAYRRLARKLHPDVNKATDAATRFNEVQQAYDTLSDDERRRRYDRFGHAGPAGFSAGGGGGGSPFGDAHFTWSNVGGRPGQGGGFGGFEADDLGSVFETIFGGGGGGPPGGGGVRGAGGRGAGEARQKPVRGGDAATEHEVDFVTAALGDRLTLRVRRSGETKSIEVTIPPGVRDGQRLRVRGEGHPSPSGGEPGDLLVTVRVRRHALFRREGESDLELDLPLTVAEAVLGATVRVPTPSGGASLRVPPGTASGKRLRLKGQGVAAAGGRAAGDLYARVQIVPPKGDELDAAQLEAVKSLGGSPRCGGAWRV